MKIKRTPNAQHLLISCFLLWLAFAMGVVWLPAVPAVWWDEGWTLSLARNWVETGHYGLFVLGTPAPAELAAAFPVVSAIAFSFHWLGVGIWQGRLVGIFFMMIALALIYHLSSRLYNRLIAVGTLFVLLLMSTNLGVHPVLNGRQVLGEMHALVYLLVGYISLLLACQRSLWFILLTLVSWPIALVTKAQVLPFWMVSLLLPLLLMLYKRQWKETGLLLIGLIGSFALSGPLTELPALILPNYPKGQVAEGLYEAVALVPNLQIRIRALQRALFFGSAPLLGLCYEGWNMALNQRQSNQKASTEMVRLALLTFVGSWFAWYILLSNAGLRYVFPAIFVGSIFVAAMLYDLTFKYHFSKTFDSIFEIFKNKLRMRSGLQALLAISLITSTFIHTLRMFYDSFVVHADTSIQEVADLLNHQAPSGSIIETYESQLFFFSKRELLYHYPPVQIHVDILHRLIYGLDAPVAYDALQADPDYLVLIPFNRVWLYQPVLETGAFELWQQIGRYEIYQRVRE